MKWIFLFNFRVFAHTVSSPETLSVAPSWLISTSVSDLRLKSQGNLSSPASKMKLLQHCSFLGTITACAYLLTCYWLIEFISVFIASLMRT